MGVPVVIGGDNLPSPVGIGLTDMPNIGGASGPTGYSGSGITVPYSETNNSLPKNENKVYIIIMYICT